MGKVIILAGAPDAASLDWTGLIDDASSGGAALGATTPAAEAVWKHYDDSAHNLTTGHAQWRSIPWNESPPAVEEEDDFVDFGESVQAQVQKEWAEQANYSRAESASLGGFGYTQSQGQSQSQLQDWSVSSADMPSLSIQFPEALAAPPPPDHRASPSAMLSSQELIEHSLAVHDALPSSLPDVSDFSRLDGAAPDGVAAVRAREPQVQRYMPASFSTTVTGSFDDTTSSTGTSSSFSASLARAPPPLPATIPRWQPLTHLADIPSADVLAAMAGRTVTVNIVATVVAASAPRDVHVRQHGNNPNRRASSSLAELVMGDDTRSGFGITVWLDAPGRAPGGLVAHPPSLASLLPTLHPQDIVLVQNLALNVFNGRVYGSTLRRNLTRMHVLHRQTHLREDQAALDGNEALFTAGHLAVAKAMVGANTAQPMAPGWWLAFKASRVRTWALQYVFAGNRSRAASGPTATGNIWMQPPACTQDTQDTQDT